MPASKRKIRGFTLIELLVAISIIAILSVIGIASFSNLQKNARDARRKADLDAIMKALAQYAIGSKIPLSNACCQDRLGAVHGCCIDNLDSPKDWYLGDFLVSHGYLASVPYDPSYGPNKCRYYYYTDADSKYAELLTHLENPSTADLATFDNGPISKEECLNPMNRGVNERVNYRIFSYF